MRDAPARNAWAAGPLSPFCSAPVRRICYGVGARWQQRGGLRAGVVAIIENRQAPGQCPLSGWLMQRGEVASRPIGNIAPKSVPRSRRSIRCGSRSCRSQWSKQHLLDVCRNGNAAHDARPKVDRRRGDERRRKTHHLQVVVEELHLATMQCSTSGSDTRLTLAPSAGAPDVSSVRAGQGSANRCLRVGRTCFAISATSSQAARGRAVKNASARS